MAKYQFAIALLLVALAIISCEAQKTRPRPVRLIQRNRQLARQEVDIPVTPYPSADELKPDIPFEETAPTDDVPVVEEVAPEASEPVPDEVYGPPDTPVLYNSPDEVYGPPELDANALPAEVVLARQKQRQARLVQARRQAAYRQAKLAKLRATKKRNV
ncbi:uncharacterized protein LOC106084735 [Stomoxys calcitrans]|uniref:DUF4794 domain-containing protein n=1 Tax=Stomoxys calcitrans TaxID=35570 RepID=A0A1I8NUN4_STOCA|nr:uncharacterized protein LOC106084735 [Stomoxys calcitrans]